MSELDTRPQLAIPGTGELVDPQDENACVRALLAVRDFEAQLRDAKQALTEAIVERCRLLGTKTLTLDDGTKASLSGGEHTVYDPEALEHDLRAAGMPEERIRQIVVETVSYQVKAAEAKRAAGANPDYAEIIEHHARVVPKAIYVVVK